MLQSLPSNSINRGEDGEVKNAIFGGVLRQRTSSQCWKRPMRTKIQEHFKNKGVQSRKIGETIAQELLDEGSITPEYKDKFIASFRTLTSKTKANDESPENEPVETTEKTPIKKDTMMYLSTDEINAIKQAVRSNTFFAPVQAVGIDVTTDDLDGVDIKGKKTAKKKKVTSDKKPPKLSDAIIKIFNDSNARISVDIATFGRMFANGDSLNVYGALKMNHSLSTHEILMEDDYFTAFDQLDPNTGAGHIGSSSFTSSTVYRYIAIDVDLLTKNLNGESVGDVIPSIIRDIVMAFPSGKENSMAVYTRPDFLNIIIRNNKNALTFSNAFENPVKAGNNGLMEPSIETLRKYRDSILAMFDDEVSLNEEVSANNSLNTVINKIITGIA